MRPKAICAAVFIGLSAIAVLANNSSLSENDAELGPPTSYTALRTVNVEPVGHINNGVLTIDRFTFEFEDGDLYLAQSIEDHSPIAVYLGQGRVHAVPPDGVELQQLRKLIDADILNEPFDRAVFWLTGTLSEQLRTLADATSPAPDAKKAADLLEERRKNLFEDQLENPDSRVFADLWHNSLGAKLPVPDQPYFYADIDGQEHDWFSIEIDPNEREEIRVARFEDRHDTTNVWMSFHALDDFTATDTPGQFPRNPDNEGPVDPSSTTQDDYEWQAVDYGLPTRVLTPDHERWKPLLSISRTDVDIAIKNNGESVASTASVVVPFEPLAVLRLRISPFAQVTDVRWRAQPTENSDDVRQVALFPPSDDSDPAADVPVSLSGDPLHFVQETHKRRMQDDLYEPWLTVFFPRIVKSDERFILEIAYKGKLVRRLRGGRGYVLKDTINWIPRHPDTRKKKFGLTFRIPEHLDIASGGRRVEDDIKNGTRVTRWIVNTPVRSTMAFQLGRFNIEQFTEDNLPPLSIYSDRNHPGFSPGSRERTSQDLIGSLRTYIDYFGPYPFESLVVTETPETDGQAFPGLVLLTFGAFGPLHSGEADLFWSHEVAHQWWGASVDWEDYRDQWISEGFAHYAAALYALIGLEDENQFNEMLDAWRHDVLGEVNVGQGIGLKRYGFRPTVIRESDGNKSGPIVAGYRLRTSDTPFDYRIQIYEKGAFILHMLRMLSLDLETGSDERFRLLMRTFAENHRGAVTNTRAFEEAVTTAFDEPMDWFFDQWVYGTDVPTYRPALKTSPVRDSVMPFVLHGTIRQENVPSEFKMAVPVRVEFEHHEPLFQRIWIDQPEISVEIPLPAEPTKILFNYQHGVLASVQ